MQQLDRSHNSSSHNFSFREGSPDLAQTICSESDSTGSSTTAASSSLRSDSSSDKSAPSVTRNVGSLRDSLALWAYQHNITHCALSDLLKTLQPFVAERIPADARTLLRTPVGTITPRQFGGGEFHYFGLERGILKSAEQGLTNFQFPFLRDATSTDLITISVNVDGLPLSKSSKSQFWPILGILDQSLLQVPFLVAIFYGQSKPNSLDMFLADFVNEACILQQNGVIIGTKKFRFRVSTILADAPARSFLKNCSIFNSYYGCERCDQKGTWKKRVVFLENDAMPRTDAIFDKMTDPNHNSCKSPLTKQQLGLVSQIPIDHMHLLFLVVMKKLIKTWVRGKLPHKLGSSSVRSISDKLKGLSSYLPKEFTRRPRPIDEFTFYKATEFRTFMLYTGVVCLYKNMDDIRYKHFLDLHCGVFILLSESAADLEWNNLANSLLRKFVDNVPEFYSKTYLVYNVHNLIHISEDARRYGNLSRVSCFHYANYMQQMKKFVRGNKHFVQQVVHRVTKSN